MANKNKRVKMSPKEWVIIVLIILVVIGGIVGIVLLVKNSKSHRHPPATRKHTSGPIPTPGPISYPPENPTHQQKPDSTPGNERDAFLSRHNCYRSTAGLPPLSWNSDCAGWAKAWAEQLCKSGQFRHPDSSEQERDEWLNGNAWGQNLAEYIGDPGSPERAVDGWYCECPYYDPSKGAFMTGTNGEDVGHYTQLMWKDTKEVGCASVDCGGGKKIYACNYNPGGNIFYNGGSSLFVQNVPKKCDINCGGNCAIARR